MKVKIYNLKAKNILEWYIDLVGEHGRWYETILVDIALMSECSVYKNYLVKGYKKNM